jgi:hypothetical protein
MVMEVELGLVKPPHPEARDRFLFKADIMPLIVGMQHPTIELSVGRDGN